MSEGFLVEVLDPDKGTRRKATDTFGKAVGAAIELMNTWGAETADCYTNGVLTHRFRDVALGVEWELVVPPQPPLSITYSPQEHDTPWVVFVPPWHVCHFEGDDPHSGVLHAPYGESFFETLDLAVAFINRLRQDGDITVKDGTTLPSDKAGRP